MNGTVVLLGFLELLLSLLSGLFLFFLTFRLFLSKTKRIDGAGALVKNNAAVAVLLAGFILGVMVIIRSSTSAAMASLGQLFTQAAPDVLLVLNVVVRILLSYILSGIIAFLIILFASAFFGGLTKKLDEYREIGENNLSAAVILGVFVLSCSLIVQLPVSKLLLGLVASPAQLQSTLKGPLVNAPLVIEGLAELPVALLGVAFVFLFGFKLVTLASRGVDEIAEIGKNNLAVSLVSSSFIIGLLILMNAALDPAYAVVRSLLQAAPAAGGVLVGIIKILLFFIGTGLAAFLMLYAALFFFTLLTRTVKEKEEIAKNNTAVGIAVAVIVIALAFILEHSLTVVLSGFAAEAGGAAQLPIGM